MSKEEKMILASSPWFWEKVKGYVLHERFITYMSLNQDSRCDANCRGCFRYRSRIDGLRNLLSFPEYVRLLEEFKRFGGLAIEISGEGEPLLPGNQTLPIIRYASGLGLWTTLITNGHFLSRDTIKELRDLKVALVVSLHSLSKEKYESDNGLPGSYESVMNAIDLIAEKFRKMSWSESGYEVRRACIHWTLQSDNLDEVENAKAFCNDRELHFSIAPLANVGHATGNTAVHPKGYSNLRKINDMGDTSIIFCRDSNGRLVCGTCRYGLNIGADGNVLLDAHGGYEVNIANIRDVSFEEAVRLQHEFSRKMFERLNGVCPVRDPEWNNFLASKAYL
ncbi:MAG: radical SAM protein [Candidatus Moranbacteria bacterium]|nr:radical SAM protein [Candidatus Moranbacteria bacterium]